MNLFTKQTVLVVDYSVPPTLFNLPIVEHPKLTRKMKIDIDKIELIPTLLKGGERSISGEENLKRIEGLGKTILDARVLEEFLKHPRRIPTDWKEDVKRIYFSGTRFSWDDGLLVVCLHWNVPTFPDRKTNGWVWIGKPLCESLGMIVPNLTAVYSE